MMAVNNMNAGLNSHRNRDRSAPGTRDIWQRLLRNGDLQLELCI